MNSSHFNNIIALCKLRVKTKGSTNKKGQIDIDRDKELSKRKDYNINEVSLMTYQEKPEMEEIDLKYLNFIDLEQITLSNQEARLIEKFYIRKNYALSLTKKKEILYWGQIIQNQENLLFSQNEQFLDIISQKQENFQDSEYFNNEEQKQMFLPKRLPIFKNIRIQDVCCNDFAVHFLSEDGMLYSMGRDQKKYGVLGLGAIYEMSTPHPNNNLIDFRISKISMGLSHCLALTTGGQIYSWGTGQNGQLCLSDDIMFSNVPKLVPNSKNMNIQNIYCSNYYTILLNANGKVTMYGTLKGFAKFLFESPHKEQDQNDISNLSSQNNSRNSDKIYKQRLKLGDEIVSKISIAEKAFAIYCQETQNLYYINDNFEAECIMRRELKSFQFLNGQKYIVAQDTNTSICTKKAQSLQLLTFMVQTSSYKQLANNFNKKYYKSFLTKQMSLGVGAVDNEASVHYDSKLYLKKHQSSPYSNSAYEGNKTRNRLKLKIDSLFGNNSSARKGRSNSNSIQERAKKLHQSLSPISRFPIINNLCEIIKQQKLTMNAKSPQKQGQNIDNMSVITDTPFQIDKQNKNFQDQLKSPQYNILLQSIGLACQITNIGTQQESSSKQLQFLSKADKIRQELNKKGVLNTSQQQQLQTISNTLQKQPSYKETSAKGNCDMIEIASPDGARNEYNLPLQIKNYANKIQEVPLQQNLGKQINAYNLSCIMEDRENNSTIIQTQNTLDKDYNIVSKVHSKNHNRLPSHTFANYLPQLMNSQMRQKSEAREMLNIDTISEISINGRESMNRFSNASDLTNTNNYKILVMNARNVIEKKILQHLMFGFTNIKYFQSNSFQTFQLQSTINHSQQSLCKQINILDERNFDDAALQMVKALSKIQQKILFQNFKNIQSFIQQLKEKSKGVKKLVQILKLKQEQTMLNSMRKIQLQIRYKKLQRLNINLLFNCFSKLVKKQQKKDIEASWKEIKFFAKVKMQFECVQQIMRIIQNHKIMKVLDCFSHNAQYKKRYQYGLKIIFKIHQQINLKKNLNQKSQAVYNFKRNVLNYQNHRQQQLQDILKKCITRSYYKEWVQALYKRKAAIQQSIFLKMFIQDKMKQAMYQAILKIINYTNQIADNIHKNQQQANPIIERQSIPVIKEFVERSIQQNDDLDIEDTQLEEGDCYQDKKYHQRVISVLPSQKLKDFSFEKNEQIYPDNNNITAHFSKLLSRGKQGVSSSFKNKPHYHCHYANEEKDCPDTFTLDPKSNLTSANKTKSINDEKNKENVLQLSQTSRMKMNIQNEISPSNNCKNYQRQTQFNKIYEQADPFELPMNDLDFPKFQIKEAENYPEFEKIMDHQFNHSNIADNGYIQQDLRYSMRKVVPFNPPEDTPSDTHLRQKQISSQKNSVQVFESKKPSNASSLANSQNNSVKSTFINNYFQKLSNQNSVLREQPPKSSFASQQSNLNNQKQQLPPKQVLKESFQQNQSQAHYPVGSNQMAQASFITSNHNIDLMHFHSTNSDASFVFFDDNFYRDSGISSASRITSKGRLGSFGGGNFVNQSFGGGNALTQQSNATNPGLNQGRLFQSQIMNNIMRSQQINRQQ